MSPPPTAIYVIISLDLCISREGHSDKIEIVWVSSSGWGVSSYWVGLDFSRTALTLTSLPYTFWPMATLTYWNLTLWHQVLPYCYSYKASCARSGLTVICNFWHPSTLTLSPDRQSARMSKITNYGLPYCNGWRKRVIKWYSVAVPIWQQ